MGTERPLRALMLSPFVRQRLLWVLVEAEEEGPRRSEDTRRSRQGDAGHRQDLPAQRGPRRDALSGTAAPWRQTRHHHVSINRGRQRTATEAAAIDAPIDATRAHNAPLLDLFG